MKFDFEKEAVVSILQEMLEDYGRMVLSEDRKCYSLWLDYAPQLPEEGELLKVFLELGLGKQVVELKKSSNEERAAWRKLAIENMERTGESRKDAASLVDAVLESLGWSVKQGAAPEPKPQPKVEPKKESKPQPKSEPKKEPKPQPKSEPKSAPKAESKGNSVPKSEKKNKKSDPILDMAKQELLNRWQRIVESYMPMIFPARAYKVDFDNLSLPKYITDVLTKYLGGGGIKQYKYLAYGHAESKGIWIVLTDTALIVHSILGESNFFVAPYHGIQEITPGDNTVYLKGSDGWKGEIALGKEGYCLVAMLRLMQGKVGKEVITWGEWMGFFDYYGRTDSTKYYLGMGEMSAKKRENVREWMNSVYEGYRENEILAVVDETVFGSCKYATVITKNDIYHKSAGGAWGRAIADIVDMKIRGTYLDIFLKNGQKITIWHIGKMPYFAELIQIYVFINQHSS